MRAFSEKKDLTIRNPNSVRPWQFILDPLYGYLCLIERLFIQPEIFSGPWNFGPKKGTNETVSYICNKIVSLWKDDAKWITKGDTDFHEASLCFLTAKSKTKIKLGFEI